MLDLTDRLTVATTIVSNMTKMVSTDSVYVTRYHRQAGIRQRLITSFYNRHTSQQRYNNAAYNFCFLRRLTLKLFLCTKDLLHQTSCQPTTVLYWHSVSNNSGNTVAHWPFSVVGAAYLHHIGRWDSTTWPHCNGPENSRWDGRTSGVTLPSAQPGTAGVVAQPPLSKRPKMPVELPWEDLGGDPSTRPGMRERERKRVTVQCWLLLAAQTTITNSSNALHILQKQNS